MKRCYSQKELAILVPAHNEGLVLENTLKSALNLVKRVDLYVVDDGSKDSTSKIAKKVTKNVLRLKTSQGKANALNLAISFFKLATKYQYIFPVDADTEVSPNFLKKSLQILKQDKEKKYVCVIGKVIGKSTNWLTSYRMWEYEVAQLIHKSAQAKEQAILVCPGCSTIYRASLFSKIQIPTDTVVEDMDLTFLIHREKLGQIAYTNNAYVVTQDPYTLKDYLKQIKRWYQGYWQCLKKHNVPWGKQTLDLELLLQTMEGLSGGLLVLLVLFSFPFILYKQALFLVIPFILDLVLFFFPTVFLTVFIHSDLKIMKYFPAFYLIRILNSLVFLYSFFESIFKFNNREWSQPTRYEIKGGRICMAH